MYSLKLTYFLLLNLRLINWLVKYLRLLRNNEMILSKYLKNSEFYVVTTNIKLEVQNNLNVNWWVLFRLFLK